MRFLVFALMLVSGSAMAEDLYQRFGIDPLPALSAEHDGNLGVYFMTGEHLATYCLSEDRTSVAACNGFIIATFDDMRLPAALGDDVPCDAAGITLQDIREAVQFFLRVYPPSTSQRATTLVREAVHRYFRGCHHDISLN